MSLGLAPHEVRYPFPPRFRSQVFPTSQRFPGRPELRGLVSCRNRSWDSSLQRLPLTEGRLPLSRQLGSLAVIHPRAEPRDRPPFAPGFADVRACAQLPGSPDDYELPFRLAEAILPVALGVEPRNRFVPPASPASKLRSLLRVRSRPGRVSSHRSVDPLLGFFPSRAFPVQASESLTRPSSWLVHAPLALRSAARDPKDPRPLASGEASLHQSR